VSLQDKRWTLYAALQFTDHLEFSNVLNPLWRCRMNDKFAFLFLLLILFLTACDGSTTTLQEPTLEASTPLSTATTVSPRTTPPALQGPAFTLPEGGKLVRIVGNGTSGYSGDGGPAAEASLNVPFDLTWDSEGNLYIGQDFRISKVDNATGVITTIAGTGTRGYSGDGGPATEAQLGRVQELAFDPHGNLYFADFWNPTIRRIDTNGVITTVAGTGQNGFSPDGTLATEAKLNDPFGIAFGSNGTLYFSDGENDRVRVIEDDGTITTVAGTGERGESGDDGPANMAMLFAPRGLEFDAQGNLYIGTYGGFTIRKIDSNGVITSVPGANPGEMVYPDSEGRLYIGEIATRIMRWTPDGATTVVLEIGKITLDGADSDDDQSAVLLQPVAVALDGAGNIYVTDGYASHSVYRFEP
jgi:sugar lactone lactonase YvrE